MKLVIKYGAIIAACIGIWVLADHYLLHISQSESRLSLLTPVFFNLAQFIVLFLGLREKRSENRGVLTIGKGIATGLAISLSYAIFASMFFVAFYLAVGSKMLENESTGFGNSQRDSHVLVGAFAGLFFGALFGGLLYSIVISFALRVRPTD
jgi:hypothetical protein